MIEERSKWVSHLVDETEACGEIQVRKKKIVEYFVLTHEGSSGETQKLSGSSLEMPLACSFQSEQPKTLHPVTTQGDGRTYSEMKKKRGSEVECVKCQLIKITKTGDTIEIP